MTQFEFKKNIVDQRIEKIKTSLVAKNEEYANAINVFSAFERGTEMSLHNTREAVAWELMVKHLSSIQLIVNNQEKHQKLPDVLTVDEKIGDAINYLILLEGMLKENVEKAHRAQDPTKYTGTQCYDKLKYNYISR